MIDPEQQRLKSQRRIEKAALALEPYVRSALVSSNSGWLDSYAMDGIKEGVRQVLYGWRTSKGKESIKIKDLRKNEAAAAVGLAKERLLRDPEIVAVLRRKRAKRLIEMEQNRGKVTKLHALATAPGINPTVVKVRTPVRMYKPLEPEALTAKYRRNKRKTKLS